MYNIMMSQRTQYAREKQKIAKIKTGTGVDDMYHSKYFRQLQFLDGFITAKGTMSNLKVRYVASSYHSVLPGHRTFLRIKIITQIVSILF